MVKKERRLNRTEIELLKKPSRETKNLQGVFFGLIYKSGSEPARFGLIISKKISPKAVERNRVKRLLYRAIEKELLGEKGLFLFLAKRNSINGKLEEFVKEIEEFRNKLER